ncbi:hypothetical protein [Leisingera sp. M523]|uniref:hypothetical protein n=1 Tax=Leisingera sp. M523 TaxID=2867013 RepID=UPI0021A4C838|nr:hypothetical protein [Leisingera sp. M523]UWQ30254.1 hypothetical protein K3557_06875 [Leisingera sp. M523]
MSNKSDFTAPADEMAGDTQTTDEEQIWKELDAEEGTAAEENDFEAAGDNKAPEDDALDSDKADEAGGAEQDDGQTQDQDIPEDDGSGEGAKTPEDDAQAPTQDELRERAEKSEQKFRSEQSRSIAQQKRADRLQKKVEALERRLKTKDQPNKEREERLNAVSEEYGDVVNPLVDEVKDLRGRLNDQSEADQHQLEEAKADLADLQAAETTKFEKEHEDGLDVIAQNPGVFRDWIVDQPKIVRDAYQANLNGMVDGTGAAMVVSRFKAALSEAAAGAETQNETETDTQSHSDTKLASRRKRQLDGAKSARSTSSQKAAGDIPPDTDDEEALWKYWDQKDAKG